MPTKKEYRRALLRSMEVESLRLNLRFLLIFLAVTALVLGVTSYLGIIRAQNLPLEKWLELIGVLAVACAVIYLPFLIFVACRLGKILRKPCSYQFYQAKLDAPQSFGRVIYFIVKLEEEGEAPIFKNTRAIFTTYGIGPRLEDFLNKTVTIAYNPETDNVVVYG